MPFVSIILPTYNVEPFIAEAMESCIQQSFGDIEIIVVDDCGSDGSIAIAKEYAKRDTRVKIVHNAENLQLFAARAEGVKVAQGEYIMFLDPDDMLDSDALQACVDAMRQPGGGELDLVCFNYRTLQDSHTHPVLYYRDAIYASREDFYLFCLKKSWINWNIWGKLLKKELYLKAFALIDPHTRIGVAEDCLLYAAYSSLIRNAITLQAPLLTYRIHAQSMSAANTPESITQHIHHHNFVYAHIQRYFHSIAHESSFAQRVFCARYLELIAWQIAGLQAEYKRREGTFSPRDSRKLSYAKKRARYKRYAQNFILKIWKALFWRKDSR